MKRRDVSVGRRRLRLALLLVVGAGSVLAYVAMAITINGQTTYEPFPGSVAVFQSTSQPLGDVVELQETAQYLGDKHPAMWYEVLVCGAQPYRGVLVATGAAQLSQASADSLTSLKTLRVTQAEGVDVTYGVSSYSSLGETGPGIQVVGFGIVRPEPCPPQLGTGLPPADGVMQLTGSAGAPIQQVWTSPFGWWHGPQASQAWPLTGTLIPTGSEVIRGTNAATARLAWYFVGGPEGSWVTPAQEFVQVIPFEESSASPFNIAAGIPFDWSIDASQPAPATASEPAPYVPGFGYGQPLVWFSTDPIGATARFTNRGSLGMWQNLLVVAGVGMGIGGAMLASLLYEMLGSPKGPDTPPEPGNDTPAPAGAHAAATCDGEPADSRPSQTSSADRSP